MPATADLVSRDITVEPVDFTDRDLVDAFTRPYGRVDPATGARYLTTAEAESLAPRYAAVCAEARRRGLIDRDGCLTDAGRAAAKSP